MSNPCTYCRSPQTDSAALCHICTDDLGRLLRGARVLADELCATPEGRGSEALDQLATTVRFWGGSVAQLADDWRTPDRNDTASWLIAQLPSIRRHEFSSTMLSNMIMATHHAVSVAA